MPGGIALATDTVGFFTILFIQIRVIQEIAIAASIGVAAIILINLVLLPVAALVRAVRTPATGRSCSAARATCSACGAASRRRPSARPAAAIVAVAALLAVFGWWKGQQVQIGDLHRGVPELRADSRYNRDTAVITSKFSIGVDILNVIAETKPEGCVDHAVMTTIDEFSWHMENLPGVHSTIDLPRVAKQLNAGWNEGSPKWRVLSRNQSVLTQSVTYVPTSTGLLNSDCSVMPVMLFTEDHKAATIERIVDAVKAFEAGARQPRRLLQARHGQRRRDGRDQRGGGRGAVADHGAACSAPTILLCLRLVPLARAARSAILLPLGLVSLLVLRAHGHARHRPQGEHAAGRGARRGHRRRLRHLPVRPLPQLLRGAASASGTPTPRRSR